MQKYVITDPCYIIKDKKNWEKYLELIEKTVDCKEGNEFVNKILNTKHFRCARTGFGDWTNFITCIEGKDHTLQNEFCADTGLVCFCELTKEIEQHLKKIGTWGYAIIECENPRVSFNFDKSDWTVIKIIDDDSEYSSSPSYIDFDDDDDAYNEAYYYDDDY